MQVNKGNRLFAVFFSVALHFLVLSIASNNQISFNGKPDTPETKEKIIFLEVLPLPPEKNFHRTLPALER